MLVISRKPGEQVRIGEDIVITILQNDGKVRLGIEAPREVGIHREEVYQRILKEQELAATVENPHRS